VPAPPLANTLEGIAGGTTITTGNSGGISGDAFSAVTIGAGSSLIASNALAAHGTAAIRLITPAVSPAATRVEWTGFGSITTAVWARVYFWLMVHPEQLGGGLIFLNFRNAAAALSAEVRIANATNFGIRAAPASGTVDAAMDGLLRVPVQRWCRFECRIVSSTTVGEFSWRLYLNPDAAVADFNDSGSKTGLVLAADTDAIRIGMVTNPLASGEVYFDSPAVSTSDWIGADSSFAAFGRSAPLVQMPLV
jgi:hypothetical protein